MAGGSWRRKWVPWLTRLLVLALIVQVGGMPPKKAVFKKPAGAPVKPGGATLKRPATVALLGGERAAEFFGEHGGPLLAEGELARARRDDRGGLRREPDPGDGRQGRQHGGLQPLDGLPLAHWQAI